MAYCRNCGADIGDAKYCPNCGTPQAIPQEEHVSRPQNYLLRFKRFSGGAPVVKTKITIDA